MVSKQLLSNELDILKNYRLTLDHPEEQTYSFTCNGLLDQDVIDDFFNRLKSMYQVSEPFVVASQFMKRYGYMITVPFLYSLSMFHKKLDISLQTSVFQSYETDGVWLPKLQIGTLEVHAVEDQREGWRTAAFESLFRDHLAPVIDQISSQAKVSKHILWENAAVYIFWIYESMMEQEPNNELLKEDFQALLDAEGSMFGNLSKNPISKFYTEKRYISHMDKEIRVRKTCCMFNRLPNSEGACTTCPLTCNVMMKEEMM
ncbi:siderophore-iron reductase FhuF [Bacillus sp. AK128]